MRVVEVVETRAALAVRKKEVPQAALLGLFLHLLHGFGFGPAAARIDLLGVRALVGHDVVLNVLIDVVDERLDALRDA